MIDFKMKKKLDRVLYFFEENRSKYLIENENKKKVKVFSVSGGAL